MDSPVIIYLLWNIRQDELRYVKKGFGGVNPTSLAESKIEQNINYVFCGVIYTLHMVSLIILVRTATDSI